MQLVLERKWKKSNYTIGILSIDGKRFCETLEDVDRNLNSSMSVEQIKAIKKPNETAIPTGTYEVTLDIFSPKFGNKSFYKKTCNGKLPRILNVKGFDGVLIHVGEGPNGKNLTSGCLLVGRNTIKGGLTQSKETFILLYNKLLEAKNKKEKIIITIK